MLKMITEKTAISVSLMVVIVGGVIWLSNIFFLADNTAKALEKVVVKQDRYSEDIATIKQDIGVIKQILKEGN